MFEHAFDRKHNIELQYLSPGLPRIWQLSGYQSFEQQFDKVMWCVFLAY